MHRQSPLRQQVASLNNASSSSQKNKLGVGVEVSMQLSLIVELMRLQMTGIHPYQKNAFTGSHQ